MHVTGLALVLALAFGPSVAPLGPKDVPLERLGTLVLTPHGEAPGLSEELALRLQDREIIPATEGRSVGDRPAVWVLVDVTGPETATLRLIVSDGRLYRRDVSASAAERARVVASTVANMVDAIEQHRLAPSEVGVDVPTPPAAETPPPKEPEPTPTPPPAKPSQTRPLPPPEPQFWLGETLGAAGLVGLGPPNDAPAFGGAGGLLGLAFFSMSGAIAGLEARVLTTRRSDTRLTRVRISLTAGYLFRRGRFEIGVTGGPTVEPLLVSSELTGPDGTSQQPAPLFGVLAATDPGVVLWKKPRRMMLRLAVRLEASYSFEARSPVGTIRIQSPESSSLLRAGGLEFAPTLTLQTRFALRARATERRQVANAH